MRFLILFAVTLASCASLPVNPTREQLCRHDRQAVLAWGAVATGGTVLAGAGAASVLAQSAVPVYVRAGVAVAGLVAAGVGNYAQQGTVDLEQDDCTPVVNPLSPAAK
jgi:hypothetical protein